MNKSSRCFALLALTAALLALALPGSAAAAGKGCPDGAYCLWKKPDFEGDKLVVHTNRLFNFPKFMNNKASSFKNRAGSSKSVFLYIGKNGNGVSRCFFDGENESEFGKANDIFSSGDVRALNACM